MSQSSWRLDQMNHLYLEVTSRCNLNCKHCAVRRYATEQNEPGFNQIVEVLEGFKNLGGEYLTISGGEPGLRKDLSSLIDEAYNIGFQVTVFTNGLACSKSVLSSLVRAGGMLALSLDGPNEILHEAIRGPGTFRQAIEALIRAGGEIGSEHVILSCLLSRPILPELNRLWEFSNHVTVGILYLSLFEPVSQGVKNHLAPEANEMVIPVLRLLDLAEEQSFIRLAFSESDDILRGQNVFSRRTQEVILGRTIKLQSDGWAFPGPFYYAPEFRLGRPIEQGWLDIKASPVFEILHYQATQRASKIAVCAECFWRDRCSAGSLAFTWATYGTWHHSCPLCHLYRATLNRSALKKINYASTITS
jgi:MoaA/NifB/PqqE/SkfB family radical SAM enzyme